MRRNPTKNHFGGSAGASVHGRTSGAVTRSTGRSGRIAGTTAILAGLLALAVSPVWAAVPNPQQTVLGSIDTGGTEPTEEATTGSVSDDGRFVAFLSTGRNLPGANGFLQAYVSDLVSMTVTLVSEAGATGIGGDADVSDVVLSGDGGSVAFITRATDIVPGFTTGGDPQLYLRNLGLATTSPLSLDPGDPTKGAADGVRTTPVSISRDGSRVAFLSSSDFTGTATGSEVQAWVVVTATADVTPVSTTVAGDLITGGDATDVSISSDGTQAAFVAAAAMIVTTPVSVSSQAYARDISNLAVLGPTRMVSTDPTGTVAANQTVYAASISDGGAVAFTTSSSNLGFSPVIVRQVFYRPATGSIQLVSHKAGAPTQAVDDTNFTFMPRISADGQRVAYVSLSDELVADSNLTFFQTYLWKAADSSNSRISVTPSGTSGNDGSDQVQLSPNGRFAAFHSAATDIVPGVGDPNPMVFVRNLDAVPPTPTPTPTPPGPSPSGSGTPDAAGLAATGLDGAFLGVIAGAGMLLIAGAVLVALRGRRKHG